ncbi:hypothetical protein CYMTET_21095 [Cymbomonas tetramitiformis]|uniref:Uncharacterized protein n=1 Tax=Cymbomonas tetramitiformis TaxID=36881 RepID=A0AAE0L382_9CHLO|nr:hypothetical protein CYMTET_21095 [Cymbomonas tetramitiformis]
MVEPFASAVALGSLRVINRHFSMAVPEEGIWIAVHCGKKSTMLSVREQMLSLWPSCPPLSSLQQNLGKIVGLAHITGCEPTSLVCTRAEHRDWFALMCPPKPNDFCFHVDQCLSLSDPLPHTGQLRLWKVGARESSHLQNFLDNSLASLSVSVSEQNIVKAEPADVQTDPLSQDGESEGRGSSKRKRVKPEEGRALAFDRGLVSAAQVAGADFVPRVALGDMRAVEGPGEYARFAGWLWVAVGDMSTVEGAWGIWGAWEGLNIRALQGGSGEYALWRGPGEYASFAGVALGDMRAVEGPGGI